MRSTGNLAAAIAITLCVAGCAKWTTEGVFRVADRPEPADAPTNFLPAPRMNPDAIQVDTAFVPITIDSQIESLWQSVDESVLTIAVRERLFSNGLRVGKLIGEPANHFANVRHDADDTMPLAALESAGIASNLSHEKNRMHCRSGQVYALPTRTPQSGEATLLLRDGDRLIGNTLVNPTCFFELLVQMQPDRRVSLRLRPNVEHGQPRNQWMGQDQVLRVKVERDKIDLTSLSINTAILPGDVLVIGPALPPRGLGKLMLHGNRADGQLEHTVLLVRSFGKPNVLAGTK